MSLGRELWALSGDLRDRPHAAVYLTGAILCLSASMLALVTGNWFIATAMAVLGLVNLNEADTRLEGVS